MNNKIAQDLLASCKWLLDNNVGGDWWCAVRGQPGAGEWIERMRTAVEAAETDLDERATGRSTAMLYDVMRLYVDGYQRNAVVFAKDIRSADHLFRRFVDRCTVPCMSSHPRTVKIGTAYIAFDSIENNTFEKHGGDERFYDHACSVPMGNQPK